MRKQCPNKTQKYDMRHNNQIFVKIFRRFTPIFQLLSQKMTVGNGFHTHLFFAP